ncbi:unnamed protein product [Gordionus sp. m RMFG-2023]|uniref:G patch domain-containing protein 1-like isoform X2 n=1 Tax=Gordionus sp. m RMFG-2023 TaxID=3053472 RepID=UPI0030DFFD49
MKKNYITYGTPLIDEDDVPQDDNLLGGGLLFKRNKPVHAQDQVVVDEKGRRRFHGAFTGGFSAGFFNSVDTKEGWNPKSFKSSRQDKNDPLEQRPEDYMDEEDFTEYGIAPKIVEVTNKATRQKAENASIKNAEILGQDFLFFKNLFHLPDKNTIGHLIFQKMGGKLGRGVGAKVVRKKKQTIFTKSNARTPDPKTSSIPSSSEREPQSVDSKKVEKLPGVVINTEYLNFEESLDEDKPLLAEKSKEIGKKIYGCSLPPGFKSYSPSTLPIKDFHIKSTITEKTEIFEFLPPDINPIIILPKNDYYGLGYTKTSKMEPATLTQMAESKYTKKTSNYFAGIGSTFEETIRTKRTKGITGQAFGYGALEDSEDECEKLFLDDEVNADAPARILAKYDIPLFREQGIINIDGSKAKDGRVEHRKGGNVFGKGGVNIGRHGETIVEILSDFSLSFVLSNQFPVNHSIDSVALHLFRRDASLQNTQSLKHDFSRDLFLAKLLAQKNSDQKIRSFSYPNRIFGLFCERIFENSRYLNPKKKSRWNTVEQQTTSGDMKIEERGRLLGENPLRYNDNANKTSPISNPESISLNMRENKEISKAPLYTPFANNPLKKDRFYMFLKNFDQLSRFKSDPLLDKNDKTSKEKDKLKQILNSLSGLDKEFLFKSLNYSGLTEWEAEREKVEFINILRFTGIFNFTQSSHSSLPVHTDRKNDHKAFEKDSLGMNALMSRFRKSATNLTLRDEENSYLKENEEEAALARLIESKQFGLGLTRIISDWHPDPIVCKRFGVKYVGEDLQNVGNQGIKEIEVFNKAALNTSLVTDPHSSLPSFQNLPFPTQNTETSHILPSEFANPNEEKGKWVQEYDARSESDDSDSTKKNKMKKKHMAIDQQYQSAVSEDILKAIFDASSSESELGDEDDLIDKFIMEIIEATLPSKLSLHDSGKDGSNDNGYRDEYHSSTQVFSSQIKNSESSDLSHSITHSDTRTNIYPKTNKENSESGGDDKRELERAKVVKKDKRRKRQHKTRNHK